MKRSVLLLALALSVPAANAASAWQNLWSTSDQRGDALMQRGDAKGAVQAFADPRRKAYAELIAGSYADAARDFGEFDDSDAQYNRGNALAHAGDLAGATKAYDLALARNPLNADARHNRDLVAKAMRQQQQKSKTDGQQKKGASGSSKDKAGKSASGQEASSSESHEQQDANAGQQPQQGSQGRQDARSGSQSASAPHSAADTKSQQSRGINPNDNDAVDSRSQSERDKKGASTTSHDGTQSNPGVTSRRPEGTKGQNAAAGQHDAGKAGNAVSGLAQGSEQNASMQQNAGGSDQQAKDDKRQAELDAGASLANSSRGNDTGQQYRDLADYGNSPRDSENRLAKEQWLRNIPDDPGGLLRRKLLIEHLMRQQKVQP